VTVTPPPASSPPRDAPAPGAASDDFTYDAFISYTSFRTPGEGSQFDRKVAERLHRALEAYRTPRSLLKMPPGHKPVPRRLRKVFRDRDEVHAGSNLNDSLTEALRRSRFLIVICSPRARQSQWINQEIAIFRSFGRGEQILPLLIEGEPAEAFVEELLKPQRAQGAAPPAGGPGRLLAQPLAADIRASSVAKSLRLLKHEKLRLLAPLLGCGYDDLRRREHERFVRRAAGAGAAMLIVLLTLAALSLLLFFAQQRENRNRQLALSASSQLLPILGLDPNSPLGINDPSIREVAIDRAISYLEMIREDDPENLDCLTILRALYGTRAGLLKDRGRPDEARESFQKAESLVVSIALSRLRAQKQAGPRGVKELSGESLSFPNNYDRQRLRTLLSIMERLEGASSIKDALDYVDTATEYVSLLDTSVWEGRGEARQVLRISLNRFHQAQRFGALTPEQEELVEAINKTLNKLPPDD
jgi:tetratricopeptide (TPR) repeat protein